MINQTMNTTMEGAAVKGNPRKSI